MIQIAIMGLGTVGTGVAKVVTENARQIEAKAGRAPAGEDHSGAAFQGRALPSADDG